MYRTRDWRRHKNEVKTQRVFNRLYMNDLDYYLNRWSEWSYKRRISISENEEVVVKNFDDFLN
jgi:hypothetical protein